MSRVAPLTAAPLLTAGLWLQLFAIGCSADGGAVAGETGIEPDPDPVDAAPLDAERAADLARYQSELARTAQWTAQDLLAAYPLPLRDALGYVPSEATNFALIQASDFALDAADVAKLDAHGFVILDDPRFPHFTAAYTLIYGNDLPVYVSADIVLYAVHQSFDEILKRIELDALLPALRALFDDMRQGLAARDDVDAVVRADLDVYLAVAASLLDPEGGLAEPVAGGDAAAVAQLVALALDAQGLESTTLFGNAREIDFSQFKPRGHYAGDKQLEAYFRASMWLGRVDMRMLESKPNGQIQVNRRQIAATLAVPELLSADGRASLAKVDRVVGAFVGESDYMTIAEVPALVSDLEVDVPYLVGLERYTDEELAALITARGYGAQRIASHSMQSALPDGEALPLASSFAILGQRYVADSFVFSSVVYDRVAAPRMLPDPLDAAFGAFANDQAAALLAADDPAELDSYAPQLHMARYAVDDHPQAGYWDATLYGHWMQALRGMSPKAVEVADPSAAGLPAVAATAAWGRRVLGSQLASWAELRHDTVLYAKQSYTNFDECEFPDAYVDPYPQTFDAIARYGRFGQELARDLGEALPEAAANLDGVRVHFQTVEGVASRLRDMAQRQRDGLPHTAEDMAFINDAISIAVTCGGGAVGTAGWYGQLFFSPGSSIEFDPSIVDVHTQPRDFGGGTVGKVLHMGTAYPRAGVVTIDTCQGPRAYVGAFSSVYSLTTLNFERRTDQEWADELVAEGTPAEFPWYADLLSGP